MFELAGRMYKQAAQYLSLSLYKMITGCDMDADSICDALYLGSGNGLTQTLLGTTIEPIWKSGIVALKGFGVAIALLFCFIGIAELALQDRLTPEQFVKHFAKFAAVFAVIMVSDQLVWALTNLGNLLTKGISKTISSAEAANAATMQQQAMGVAGYLCSLLYSISDSRVSFGDTVGLYLVGAMANIPYMCLQIARAAVFFIALSRGLELTIRGIFMPIPMALLADGGWHSAGGRYVKKFCAVASQGMVIVVIVHILQEVVGKVAQSNMSWIVKVAAKFEGTSYVMMSIDSSIKYVSKDLGIPADLINSARAGIGEGVTLLDAIVVNVLDALSYVTGAGKLKGSHVFLNAVTGLMLPATFTGIAIIFAGVGAITKSLQICNDIWGV